MHYICFIDDISEAIKNKTFQFAITRDVNMYLKEN